MKIINFFKVTFLERDWGMFIAGIMSCILVLAVSALIICVIFSGVNIIGRREYDGIGVVVGKHFTPSHWTSYGKGQSKWVKDAWSLRIKKNNLSDCVDITEYRFNKTNIGDNMCIRYCTGRLWSSMYIIRLCESKNDN